MLDFICANEEDLISAMAGQRGRIDSGQARPVQLTPYAVNPHTIETHAGPILTDRAARLVRYGLVPPRPEGPMASSPRGSAARRGVS